MRIASALMAQDRLSSVRHHIERVLPYVDVAVVVDNGSTDGSREWLRAQEKVILVERQWNDSFVEGRNTYLRAIDQYAKREDTQDIVVCVADDDELYSDALLQDLHQIASMMWEEDLNLLRVRSRSVETDWQGKVMWSNWDDWHKPLIMAWEPGMSYVGIGRSEVHEDLRIPSGRRERLLEDGGKYYYDHVKPHGEIWLRGIRNFFAGGGGPNLGEANPLWRPFRAMVKEIAEVENAAEFVKYLRAGGIHPRVLDWFTQYRKLGTPHDPTLPMWPGWPDGTSEVREGWLAYYVYLHPEELPLRYVVDDLAYADYRREVQIIHGPKAPAWNL